MNLPSFKKMDARVLDQGPFNYFFNDSNVIFEIGLATLAYSNLERC